MTTLLEQAFARVLALPPAARDEIARAMIAMSELASCEPEAIDPAHLADVADGLEQAKRGAFASDTEVAAAFARFSP